MFINDDIKDIVINLFLNKLYFCPNFLLINKKINEKYRDKWEQILKCEFYDKITTDWNILKKTIDNDKCANLMCLTNNFWTFMSIKYNTHKILMKKIGNRFNNITWLDTDKKIKRLLIRDINQDLNYKENNLYVIIPSYTRNRLLGIFLGPINSPYSGGLFIVELLISENTAIPTKIKLITEIYHPNIQKNEILLDILHENWSPLYRLQPRLIILSLQSILNEPELSYCHDYINDNSLNLEQKQKIEEYQNNYEQYIKKAQEYTIKYANYSEKDIHNFL